MTNSQSNSLSIFKFNSEIDNEKNEIAALQKFTKKVSEYEDQTKRECVNSFTPLNNRIFTENTNIKNSFPKPTAHQNFFPQKLQFITNKLFLPIYRATHRKIEANQNDEIRNSSDSTDNLPPSAASRRRAKSSILDIKIPRILKKTSLFQQIYSTVSRKNDTMTRAEKKEERNRKSSLSVFENFTGRKVSEQVYYQDSPKIKKMSVYKAEGKIERLKRLQLDGKKIVYPFLIIPSKSGFKISFDFLIFFFVFYNSISNPLEIAFQINSSLFYFKFMNVFVSIIYFLDIFINFRTTYYDQNNDEIVDGSLIFKHYFKSIRFLIDVFSALPISEIVSLMIDNLNYIKFINLLKFFRLIRLTRIYSYFHNESYTTIFQICRLVMLFIILFHWVTCLWYFLVSMNEDLYSNDYNTWLPINLRSIYGSVSVQKNYFVIEYYHEQDEFGKYSYSLYSILLMIIGSEMGPTSSSQAIGAIIVCIIGSFFYAFFFSEIILLITKLNHDYSLYQIKFDNLEVKLQNNSIPHAIKARVYEYFEYYWKKQKIFENLAEFSNLSQPLKREILFHVHKDIVINVPLFKELEPEEILQIIQRLKVQIYLPQDYIITEGETGTEMYFLNEGLAEVLLTREDKRISIILKKGSYFGEIALITNSRRTSDVRAIDFCVVNIFTKDEFEKLKKQFLDIHERLAAGLKHYKINHIDNIINVLKKNELFQGICEKDLFFIVMNYMEEIFLDPQEILLLPKKHTNALYFLLLGKIKVYLNTEESRNLIKDLILQKEKTKNRRESTLPDTQNEIFHCIDDEMFDFPQILQDDYRLVLNMITLIGVGDMMGGIVFENNETNCEFYYFTDSACQLCILSQANYEQLRFDRMDLYQKINDNYKKSQNYYISKFNECETSNSNNSVNDNDYKMMLRAKKSVFLNENISTPTDKMFYSNISTMNKSERKFDFDSDDDNNNHIDDAIIEESKEEIEDQEVECSNQIKFELKDKFRNDNKNEMVQEIITVNNKAKISIKIQKKTDNKDKNYLKKIADEQLMKLKEIERNIERINLIKTKEMKSSLHFTKKDDRLPKFHNLYNRELDLFLNKLPNNEIQKEDITSHIFQNN